MKQYNFEEKVFLRDIMGSYMSELGKKHSDIVVVNADLMGTSRNRGFVEMFPERSFNVGIAEQNMVSFAAGLAKEGFQPFAFSMAPFLSMRACEQCRSDVAYGNLNVRLMATYAGLSGGISGATHWSIEDCGIMTSIPNMVVLEPCDSVQACSMLDYVVSHKGPVYMRISCEPTISIYDEGYSYKFGCAHDITEGDDGAFICCGITVKYALEAAKSLYESKKLKIRVVDTCGVKPLDNEKITSAAKTGHVVVAHDHNVIGGLGQNVAEIILESGIRTNFVNAGIPDEFAAMAHAPFLYNKYGYDASGLEKAMLSIID